ncbi:hypothetical protein ACF3NS_02970 [Arsenicicoccus cauae]|uniref:hypothetical protein n=1 Tax=Arsenicicoccus cauae TaxID=2663847 RepID=UPI00370DC96A
MTTTHVADARTTQAPTHRHLAVQAALLAALAVVLTVVGGVLASAPILLSALVPLAGTVAAFLTWNARELSRA